MRRKRGMALITALLVATLVLAVLAFVVTIGTSQLRRSTEELWELQAQAGADGAVGWARALIANRQGDIAAALGDMAAVKSTYVLSIDDNTEVDTSVTFHLANVGAANDHVDVFLQQDPSVAETPLQVSVTATVMVGGTAVATRSTTALVRVFRQAAPYSEVTGFIDNAGPVGIDSPGDPAGQAGSATATELRIHVFKTDASGNPIANDSFGDQTWSDGNSAPSGALP
jgi:hypothetical protein